MKSASDAMRTRIPNARGRHCAVAAAAALQPVSSRSPNVEISGDPVRKALAASLIAMVAATGILVPSMAAFAAPPCLSGCVVTFTPGAQTTWSVPANATDVSVVVAGGAGGNSLYAGAPGGPGGQVTVDLATAYNGQTLHVLVGAMGHDIAPGLPGGGGEGSYLSATSGFLVIAGGGGGTGALEFPPAALPGGAGGYATASADGADGPIVGSYNDSGFGAVGATPGTATTQPGLASYGGTGGVASVASDGTITAGVGGDAATFASFPIAQGGGGYAGGGGGSAENGGPSTAGAGGGGGGSGFLAAGLTASAVAPNTADGSITFTYSLAPTITAPLSSVAVGDSATTTVGSLPASTAFTVVVTGSAVVVGSGTVNANGDPVTLSFTVPAGTSLGAHTLSLIVAGSTVATSPAFTVTALTLAATGVAVPWWVPSGAGLVVLLGVLLLWRGSRQRQRHRATD